MADGGMPGLPAQPPFFAALPLVRVFRPSGVDLGTAFLHHLDRKAL